LLSGLSRPIAAESGGDLFRARVTDREQSIEHGLGQMGLRSSDASEQNNALLVGDWSDRIDEFHGRFLLQIAD
jgi:hypothetical protein